MEKLQKVVHNAKTGETVVLDLTDDEIREREQRALELEAAKQAEAEAEAARVAARESALAKLAALGLTEEEAAAIIK